MRAIKFLLGTLLLAMANFTLAMTFVGSDEDGNEVSVDVLAYDITGGPLPGLGYGCFSTIIVSYASAPVTFNGHTYSSVSGHNPSWQKHFFPCVLPDEETGDVETGFVDTYIWGATLGATGSWDVPSCDGSPDANNGADIYTGAYNGTNNPLWDCGKLVIYTSPSYDITAVLSFREIISSSPTPTVENRVYHLVPQ